MSLDTATLLTVASCVTGLLGVFILVCWAQDRGTRALAWWGAAYLIGGSAVGLWGANEASDAVVQAAPNALLFIACGMIWNGARLFHGRTVQFLGMFAGAISWIAAMQVSSIAGDGHLRIVLSSLIVASYAFLAALELRRERRRSLGKPGLSPIVPLLHGIVFLSPIPLALLTPPDSSSDSWFALFALQTLLYVVGTAFIVIIMTNERTVLGHKTAAMTDPLTGLFNRRAFFDVGQQLMTRLAKTGAPVGVLVFDLDHFKAINDRFGHAVGDQALQLFAATARKNLRATDVLGRLGGEEFVAILPGGPAEVMMVGERLRAAFAAAAEVVASCPLVATVSIGAAAAVAPADIGRLLERADAALYAAKTNGRNRVELSPNESISKSNDAAVPVPRTLRAAITRLNPFQNWNADGTIVRS